jgi:hypothetical protein
MADGVQKICSCPRAAGIFISKDLWKAGQFDEPAASPAKREYGCASIAGEACWAQSRAADEDVI